MQRPDLEWEIGDFRQQASPSPLFKGLSKESLHVLARDSIIQNYPAGKILVQQGDNPSHSYFILDGIVKTLRSSSEGEEAIIRMLRKGDTFIETVLFMNIPSPIGMQVVEDSKILLIPVNTIKALARQDGRFASALLEIVAQHYKIAMQQVDSMTLKSPVQRVGYYFLKLKMEQGCTNGNITLPFKKSMIANHLGMKPETFSRALQQLKKLGIETHHEKIILNDPRGLCTFCDSDMAYYCGNKKKHNCTL